MNQAVHVCIFYMTGNDPQPHYGQRVERVVANHGQVVVRFLDAMWPRNGEHLFEESQIIPLAEWELIQNTKSVT